MAFPFLLTRHFDRPNPVRADDWIGSFRRLAWCSSLLLGWIGGLASSAQGQTPSAPRAAALGTATGPEIRVASPLEADHSASSGFHRHIDVPFAEHPDYTLRCDVFVPEGPGPFPAVLALHGGAWRFGSKWQLARQVRRFTQAGFVVVAANYRLAPEWKFPAQVQDGFAALAWMREHAQEYSIDTDNLFGYGYSAGGHLISLMAVSRPEDWTKGAAEDLDFRAETGGIGGDSSCFRGVAVGGAPCDFEWIEPQSDALEYWLGGSPQDAPTVYEQVAPRNKVSAAAPPFFLFHAADDVLVPVACAQRMERALVEHRVPCQLLVLEQSSHLAAFNDAAALERAIEFFRAHMRNK